MPTTDSIHSANARTIGIIIVADAIATTLTITIDIYVVIFNNTNYITRSTTTNSQQRGVANDCDMRISSNDHSNVVIVVIAVVIAVANPTIARVAVAAVASVHSQCASRAFGVDIHAIGVRAVGGGGGIIILKRATTLLGHPLIQLK
jgi:hypothetical protein